VRLLGYVFRIVNSLDRVPRWFHSSIFGRMDAGMRGTSAWLFKYELQTKSTSTLLMGRYPSPAGRQSCRGNTTLCISARLSRSWLVSQAPPLLLFIVY
jgi:hypothetical protein